MKLDELQSALEAHADEVADIGAVARMREVRSHIRAAQRRRRAGVAFSVAAVTATAVAAVTWGAQLFGFNGASDRAPVGPTGEEAVQLVGGWEVVEQPSIGLAAMRCDGSPCNGFYIRVKVVNRTDRPLPPGEGIAATGRYLNGETWRAPCRGVGGRDDAEGDDAVSPGETVKLYCDRGRPGYVIAPVEELNDAVPVRIVQD